MNETTIIKNYLKAWERYNKADEILKKHFRDKVKDSIEAATCIAELQAVKENLRTMPDSAGKVLIFREILMREKQLQ